MYITHVSFEASLAVSILFVLLGEIERKKATSQPVISRHPGGGYLLAEAQRQEPRAPRSLTATAVGVVGWRARETERYCGDISAHSLPFLFFP